MVVLRSANPVVPIVTGVSPSPTILTSVLYVGVDLVQVAVHWCMDLLVDAAYLNIGLTVGFGVLGSGRSFASLQYIPRDGTLNDIVQVGGTLIMDVSNGTVFSVRAGVAAPGFLSLNARGLGVIII